MEEQELRNFLRGEGEQLVEVAIPTIDTTERCLEDIADEIENEGLDHLVKNLGTIANTFKTENGYTCSPDVIAEGVKVIYTAMLRLYNGITAAQENVKTSLVNIDRQTKLKFRRHMAIIFYLIYKSFTEIERAVATDNSDISMMVQNQMGGQKGRKGRKPQAVNADDSKYQFWNVWRPRIISELLKLVSPPLNEVWEENLDYNFMRCVTLALCTTVKNRTKRLRHMDQEMEDAFDVLGVLAARHQEEKGILSRLIPLLKESEETASIIADGIARMIDQAPENQSANIVLRSLTEALDTYMTRLEKDNNAEKGFHAFLTQFVVHQPKGYLHSLPVVVQFLEAESPTVRNAVIIVAHHLMNSVWEEMRQQEKPAKEVSDERPNQDNQLQVRRKLLDEILLKHLQDVAAVVRSKSIQLLADIVEQEKLVPSEGCRILKHVKLRLLDKNNTPRKNATLLVIDIVKNYPHMQLSVEAFMKNIGEKWESVENTIKQDYRNDPAKALFFVIKEFHLHRTFDGFYISKAVKDLVTDAETAMTVLQNFLKEGQFWKACETMYICTKKFSDKWEQIVTALKQNDDDLEEEIIYMRFFKSIHKDIFPDELADLELNEIVYICPSSILAARDYLQYTLAIYQMKQDLQECLPSLKKLLELGTTTDKKEAVMFFATISQLGYVKPHVITVSIINALSQLNEEELKDFVEPFKSIFIGSTSEGSHVVVKKLIELVQQLPENLVESLSSIIGQLYRAGTLNGESIQILWDAFSLTTGDWEPSASCNAAHILGIIGQIEKKIITSNLNQLVEVGLGDRGIENYELAKVSLQAILLGCRGEPAQVESEGGKAKSKAPKTNAARKQAGEDIKFPPTHDLFNKIVSLIEYGLKTEGNSQVDAMYPRVVELSTQIIYRMCTEPIEVVKRFLVNIHGLVFAVDTNENAEVDLFKLSERILFRYMSFGKALLGAHITFYEQIVSKEIKERKAIREKENKKTKTASRQRSRLSNSSHSTTNSSMMNSINQEAAEMDLVMGHIGFDAEQDSIKSYIAKLLDQGFFRQFRVHVYYLCQKFTTMKSVNLKVSCVQALAKLMLVCEASCVKSLDTLMGLWTGNEPFPVKLEILRASIRLTVKFPNQMEKMNDVLTTGLASKDTAVRKACMDYIQYLALSDLLKVREQLSDTAACLCDDSFELREMARDFLNQIAEKDNVLQNSIPDIISRLSAREDIPQTKFQEIMKQLLQKIKKEKQLGGLVERIVGRFKGIVPVRTCQDTVFCLNQIQHNEKTLKIMKDNITSYADKLADPIVWDLFEDLIKLFHKNLNKPELKVKIEEWEKELHEYHEKCVALDSADKAAKRKNDKRPEVMEESSSDEEEQEQQNDEPMDNDGEEGEGAEEAEVNNEEEGEAEGDNEEVEADEDDGNDNTLNGEEDETMEQSNSDNDDNEED